MLKNKIIILVILMISMTSVSFSHSGRTDSNGGHYSSATGEYHYHHGYSAHQHPNGICPYETSSIESDEQEELLVVNDDSKYINTLNEKINTLESQIAYKQNSIGKLNNEIANKDKEIKSLKSDKSSMWTWFIIIFLIGILVAYGIGKSRGDKK